MRKNVMLSLLAATTASLGVFADADVSNQLNTKELTTWTTNVTPDINLENGVFTATNKSIELTQTVKGLLPGKYQLTTTSNVNAKISLNGKMYDQNTILLTETSDLVIKVVSADGTNGFTVGGFGLKLIYDFKAIAENKLTPELSRVILNIHDDVTNSIAESLKTEASNISKDIAVVQNTSSYDDYKTYLLYKGYDQSTIWNAIKALAGKVEAANNNGAYYKKFVAVYDSISSELANVETQINSATQYAKDKYSSEVTTTKTNLTVDKVAADAANVAGSAGSIDLVAFKKKYAIKQLSDKITTADLDITAFSRVNPLIEEFNTKNDSILKNLIVILPSTPDVYGDMLIRAQEKLKAVKVRVSTAVKANGTKNACDGAAKTETENTKIVKQAIIDIGSISTLYTDSASTLKAAYKTAKDTDLVERQKTLDGYNTLAKNIRKTYTNSTVIKNAIDLLSTRIAKENATHTIDAFIKTKVYSDALYNIDTLEVTFGKILRPDSVNYSNNKLTTDCISALKTALSKAKTAVDKLVSSDGVYVASDRYSKTYQDLAAKMQAYTDAAGKAYSADTAEIYYNKHTAEIKDKGSVVNEINKYQSDATETYTQYNKVAPIIKGYRNQYETTEGAVADTAVICYTYDNTKTYGTILSDANKTIIGLEKALTDAVGSVDTKHYTLMMAISTDATSNLVTALKNYVSSYPIDKPLYDKYVSQKAAKSMLTQDTLSLSGMKKKFASYQAIYTQDALGMAWSDITETLNKLTDNVNTQYNNIAKIDPTKDPTGTIATLSTVNDSIGKFQIYISNMVTAASNAMASVKANKDQMVESKAYYQKYYNQLNGNNEVDPKIIGVAGLIVDSKRKNELDNTISGLNNRLEEQLAIIRKDSIDETLVKYWANDHKDEDGNTTITAIKTMLDNINSDIANARTSAQAITDNYNANQRVWNAYIKVDFTDSLKNAKAYVIKNAVDFDDKPDAAQAYFLGKLGDDIKGYTKEVSDLYNNISKDYTDRKSLANEGTKITAISTLSSNIQNIVNAVIPNKNAYYSNMKDIAATQKTWNALYDTLSVNDRSIEAKDYLTRLAAQQTIINTITKNLNDKFNVGTCASYDGDAKKAIADVNTQIVKIKNDQIAGYEKAIKDDNLTRYNEFVDVMNVTKEKYNNAINTINSFNKITNSDLRAGLQSIIDANKTIYDYSSKIATLEVVAKHDFDSIQTLIGPVTFDLEKKYENTAIDLKKGIEDALDGFTTAVNSNAIKIFKDSLDYAQDALNSALGDIKEYDNAVWTDAFKEVRDTIAFARKAESEVNCAIIIDGIIGNYTKAKIDAMIANGYKPADVAEWTKITGNLAAKYNKDLNTISSYTYQDASKYVDQYKDLYTKYITDAKQTTSITNKYYTNYVQKGILNTKIIDVKNDTISYIKDAKKIFDQATDYNSTQTANKNAYDQMYLDIDTVQQAYNAVEKYVNAYVAKDSIFTSLAVSRKMIADLKADVEANKNCASEYQPTFIKSDRFTTAIPEIKKNIELANQAEARSLGSAVGILKSEFNTAIAAGKKVTDTKMVGFKTEIDEYEKSVKALNDSVMKTIAVKQDTLQAGLLAIENKMALTRQDIVNYYNASLVADTYSKLVAATKVVADAYTKETDEFADCSASVQNTYTTRLTMVNTNLDIIKKDIEAKKVANTIIFYKEGLNNAINAIADSLKNVTVEIAAAQVPITVNENQYKVLMGQINGFKDRLAAINTKVSGYVTAKKYNYSDYIKDVKDLINTDSTNVTSKYKAILLTANSKNANVNDITNDLNVYEKVADHNEADSLILGLEKSLTSAYDKSVKNTYVKAMYDNLFATYHELDTAIVNLKRYNTNAYSGNIPLDVNGDSLIDSTTKKVVVSQPIDYLKTADAIVFAKFVEIQGKIDTYLKNVITNNYILGDVNHDGYVRIGDYTEVLRIILGLENVTSGSVIALAADANNDGEISVGDLTTIINIIKGISSNGAKGIGMDLDEKANDVLSLSAASQGTTQRIAINLTNVNPYVNCQMDIQLPLGMTLISESLSSRANGHELSSNDLSNGTHRVVISSQDNNEFGDSESAILYLNVVATNSTDLNKISVSNIKFSDASAHVYNFADIKSSETTGINSIASEQGLSSKIYSVSGKLMNALRKGVNIIRNSNGSTQKMIKR
jgi:hypothetical protein